MTDIFISYSRLDKPRIERLAENLSAAGFDVWWDRQLQAGVTFAAETEARLNEAKAVLVAWSVTSIGSMWVADEASVGREKRNLVPIAIDDVPPPLGFRQIQTLPFSDWNGDPAASEFGELVAALQRMTKSAAPQTDKSENSAESKTPSIAVLPFANMSPDSDQAYFSDGVAEEIIIALMKIDGIRVVGRTSSFSYKGKDVGARTIGRELSATHLLDGSVRKFGDRVRISVQLISARDGFHIWSQSYDRSLDDIFDVQDEIARAVVSELRIKLAGATARLVDASTAVDEAYQLFLQGRYILRQRYGENGGVAISKAIELLSRAITLDPNFAQAHSNLSLAYTWMPQYAPIDRAVSFEKAKRHAAEASRLDPNLGEHIAGLAVLHLYERDYVASLDCAKRAIALTPQDATVQRIRGNTASLYGYADRSQSFLAEAVRIDPTSGMEIAWAGEGAFLVGDFDRARKYSQLALSLNCRYAKRILAELAARDGDFAAAGAYFTNAILRVFWRNEAELAAIAADAFGNAAAKARASAALDRLIENQPEAATNEFVIILFIKIGRFDDAVEFFLRKKTNHEDAILAEIWNPQNSAFRKSAAFVRLERETNLGALWKSEGRPALI